MVRRIWQNGAEGGTPLNATNLNALEDDVEQALSYQLVIGTVKTGASASASLSTRSGQYQKLDLVLPSDTGIGYLFACFTSNGVWGEKLSLFYSPDGKIVTGGGLNPVYADPNTGTSLRDPSLIFYNNAWYVTYTVNNGFSKNLAVIRSENLINWTQVALVDLSGIAGVNQIWAPDFTIDPANNDVYIHFSRGDTANVFEGWYIKATNLANLSTWAAPAKMVWSAALDFGIDYTFVKRGTTWYCFFSRHGQIYRATSTSLTGTWTVDKTGDWMAAGTDIEGPFLTMTETGSYRLYADKYTLGTGYAYTESTDLTTWGPWTNVAVTADWKPGETLRHGSMWRLASTEQLTQAQAAMGLGTKLQHVEFTGTITEANGVVANLDAATVDGAMTTDPRFVANLGTGRFTLVGAGIYQISLAANIVTGSGVTRSFLNFEEDNNTLIMRAAGGAEDALSLNTNYRVTGARTIRFRGFSTNTGTSTWNYRLRITRVGY